MWRESATKSSLIAALRPQKRIIRSLRIGAHLAASKGLPDEDRRIIGLDIATVEYGLPVGMPICRAITGRRGLWEVRNSLPGGRIARVLFCIHRGLIFPQFLGHPN